MTVNCRIKLFQRVSGCMGEYRIEQPKNKTGVPSLSTTSKSALPPRPGPKRSSEVLFNTAEPFISEYRFCKGGSIMMTVYKIVVFAGDYCGPEVSHLTPYIRHQDAPSFIES